MTWPKDRLRSIAEVALMLTCAMMPVNNQWVVPPLAIAILCLFLSGRWGQLRGKFGLLAFPIGFYLLYVLGMLNTTDTAFGWFDLEIKASLLLLPIGFVVGRPFAMVLLRKCMMGLTVGLFVGTLISAYSAITCYVEHGWIQCFTASYLSSFIHPSYQAWYAVFAFSYWGGQLIQGKVGTRVRPWLVIAEFLLLIYIVMLSSKTGWICLLIALVFLLVIAVRTLKAGARNKLIIGSLIFILIPAFLLKKVIADRTMEVVNSLNVAMTEGLLSSAGQGESTGQRLVAWGCSSELIAANPLGVGTGDIKNELVACYEQHGADGAADKRLNSHSQLMQSGVALGWPGIIIFLLFLLIPSYWAFRERDRLLLLYMLFFIVNALVESVLEVQAGVVFIALFYSLLLTGDRNPSTTG